MKIGYCRVSTKEQNPDLQLRALKKAGCKTIYTDKDSGAFRKRIYLQRCLKELKASLNEFRTEAEPLAREVIAVMRGDK